MRRVKSIVLLVMLAAFGYSMFNASLYDAYNIILNTNINAVISLLLIEILIVLVSGIKWGLFVNSIKKIGYLKLMPVFFASEFICYATPGTRVGGEPYRAYKVSRWFGIDLAKSMAATVIDKMCDYVIFFIISIGSIFAMSFMFDIPTVFSFALEMFVLFVMASVVSGYLIETRVKSRRGLVDHVFHYIYNFHFFTFFRKRFGTYHVFERYCISKLHKFSHQISVLAKNRGLVEAGFFMSSLRWALIYLQGYMAFVAIGYDISMMAVIVAVTISIVLSFFIAIPAGFGISEISMIAIYTSIGVPPEVALAGTLLVRSFNYLFGIGFNYIVFVLVEGFGLK